MAHPILTSDFCFQLKENEKGKRIDLKDIKKYPKAKLWIHLDYQKEKSHDFVRHLNLGKSITNDLLDPETSPHYFLGKTGLMVIMRGVNMQKNAEIDDMISLRIWIDAKRIITLSHRHIAALDDITHAIKKGKGPKSPMDCFLTIAGHMTEGIANAAVKIDDKVDEIEDVIVAAGETSMMANKELRMNLSSLRHDIIGLRRYLVPQLEMLRVLKSATHPLIVPEDSEQLNAIFIDLLKAVEDLNFARDHSNVSQEELDSKINISISQTMYIMSIVMVIFTPLTFITGLLGANIGGIPFGENTYGFLFICLFLILMAVVQIIVIKKMRWF
ncbi:MAG: hypothetical protein LBU87_01920 [Lactobacillales bacterium]|jgi:zinc transporter|nr:hypothetical protein [Lactobacillales bacterium]